MNAYVSSQATTDAPVLRSIADSIEVVFPSAADTLRGIANKIEEEENT